MRTVVLTVPEPDAELAADVLWRIGVSGVEERSLADGEIEIRAVVGDTDDAAGRLAGMVRPTWSVAEEPYVELMSDEWRDHVQPTVVADSVMTIPDWIAASVPQGMTAVRIDPAGAFGLGDHPTTILSIEHVVEEIDRRPNANVADIGCGSGVLGIVALLRGAASVRAVDVSGAAVEATAANAERNEVAARLVADTTPAAELDGPFDVVVANILAPVLVSLAPTLGRLVGPTGSLIVSGLVVERVDHVIDALRPLTVTRRSSREGWCALTLSRATP